MQHPIIITLASIIPGLGFLLLKQPKRAFVIMGLLAGLLEPGFITARTFVGQMACGSLVLLWLAQMIFTFQIAYTNWQVQNGTIQPANDVSFQPTRHQKGRLSNQESAIHLSRTIARQQLQDGDRLLLAIIAREKCRQPCGYLQRQPRFLPKAGAVWLYHLVPV